MPIAGSPFTVFVKSPPVPPGKPSKIYAELNKVLGVAINSKRELVVIERDGDVLFLDRDGKQLRSIQRSQHGFHTLFGVAVDRNDSVYLTDSGLKSIFKFDSEGKHLLKAVKPALQKFLPKGITISGEQVVVADGENGHLLLFTEDLQLEGGIDWQGGHPVGIACDENGIIFGCDFRGNCIKAFNCHGEPLGVFYGSESHKLQSPHSLCINRDLIYITEWRDKACISGFTKQGYHILVHLEAGGKTVGSL